MDGAMFAELVEPHRRELRVHCYRMLGSFDEAEDMVQETYLRAWRGIAGFEGRSSVRVWLYRIATNACLDALDGRARRVLPQHLSPPSDLSAGVGPRTDIAWLQPFPGRLWEPAAARETEPDAVVVDRETIELAFLAAIQYLPARQRAALLLRDVLGWAPSEIAATLESTVASANSALQRARATLRERLPERRADWAPAAPDPQERAVLRQYMNAMERGDVAAVAALLAEDVRSAMPPWPYWFRGRAVMVAALAASWEPGSPDYVGSFRTLPTRANGRPAVACYARAHGDAVHRAFAICVLVVENGLVAEATAFHDTRLFPAFDLPTDLPAVPSPADR